MKPNRRLIATILKVLCALCVAAPLLLGCATTGRDKEAGPEAKPGSQSGAPGTSVRQETAVTPQSGKAPAVSARVSTAKPAVQKLAAKPTAQAKAPRAASGKRDWGRVFWETLSGLDWNRVLVVIGGVLGMAFFWILAFWLGRLPARRGHASRRAAIHAVGEPVPATE